jgi:hypothetical protein
MNKLNMIAVMCMVACSVFAGERWESFEVAIGTNATATVTDSKPIIGEIDEIYIQNPSKASVTSTVAFVVAPVIGTNLTATTVYTNAAHTASVKARPRILGTDTAGSNLSSLAVAERFVCVGETVTFSVTQASSVTGLTIKAWVKIK